MGDLEETESEFLERYVPGDFAKPSVTVDLVILTVIDADLKVLLVRRGGHPHRGRWALPGGFVNVGDGVRDQGEDLEDAAHRELQEETGLPRGACHLEQLYTFGAAGRDPRTRVITVAHVALVRPTLAPLVAAGDDAADAAWFSVAQVDRAALAFDHGVILNLAVERIRGKLDYSAIAFDLVGETFTVSDLRAVYEAVKGHAYDAKTFHRKFRRLLEDGVLLLAPGKRITGARPAAVYRFRARS